MVLLVPPKSKADYAFISHMIDTTTEGTGRVGVVVPLGVLFRGGAEGKIRKALIEENLLDAVTGLPLNLFFGAGIPTAILIFRRDRDEQTKGQELQQRSWRPWQEPVERLHDLAVEPPATAADTTRRAAAARVA